MKKIKGIIFCLPVIFGCCMATNTYAQKMRPFSQMLAEEEKTAAQQTALQEKLRAEQEKAAANKTDLQEKLIANNMSLYQKPMADAINSLNYCNSDMSNKIDAAVGALDAVGSVGTEGRCIEKIKELFNGSKQHRYNHRKTRARWVGYSQTLRLDMHGYNVPEATGILHDLIDSIRGYNRTAIKRVSLITGVGNNNETHEPILTNAIKEEAAKICPYATVPNNPGMVHLYPFGFNRPNRNT